MNNDAVKWVKKAHTSNMLLISKVKVIHFLFERVQNLSMSGHVSGQYQGDGSLSEMK